MSGSPSIGGPSASIENGNRLGARPVVRQSKFYREGNSGNAVKDLLGQGDLAWDLDQQQGAFSGQPMYDGRQFGYMQAGPAPQPNQVRRPPQAPQLQQQQQRRGVSFPAGMAAPVRGGPFQLPPQAGQVQSPPAEVEYPLPGSVASCDACGQVVDRYYHCAECQEHTGLFDLCVRCCGAIYLQGGRKIPHPTHDYVSHTMQHVVPVR